MVFNGSVNKTKM